MVIAFWAGPRRRWLRELRRCWVAVELEDLIGHVEGPDVARAGVGCGNFGEDVGWSDDREGRELGKLGQDLGPPCWVVVTAWTGKVGDNAFDMNAELVRSED